MELSFANLFARSIFRLIIALLPACCQAFLYLYLGTKTLTNVDFLPVISLVTESGPGFSDLDEVSVYNPFFLLAGLLTLIGTFNVPNIPLGEARERFHLHISYVLNVFVWPNWRFTTRYLNSPFSILIALVARILRISQNLKATVSTSESWKPFELTPVTVLPGTIILLFINLAYIVYKFDYYEIWDRDEMEIVYKIAGNTLGKIGTIMFGLFLIPVSTFSPILAALGVSQEIGYAFHRSAGILAVIEIVIHGVLHTLGYYVTKRESENAFGAPTIIEWTVWPAKECYGEKAEGPDYECHACSCYHTKANATGFWSVVFMLVVCFTSVPQIRRNWYKVFYWCHIIFALPALLLMLMHWSGMAGYFLPSLVIWGLSKSLQLFENLSIVLRGGTLVCSNDRVKGVNLSEMKLPIAAGSTFVPGQFVRLSLITPGNLSIFEPSHPYTIASSPSSGFINVLFASDTKFGRRLAELGNSDRRSRLVCRGHFGPNDRYDRIHAAACSLEGDGVLIVAGGVGCTPYLSILSQLIGDLEEPEGKVIKNVTFVLICRGTGLLEYLRGKLNEYASAGIKVRVYVTPEKKSLRDHSYEPVVNALVSGGNSVEGLEWERGGSSPFQRCGRIAVSPHPLMPGVMRPSERRQAFLSLVLTPVFWLGAFYASLKLIFWYTETVQSHHVVESRIWMPLALVCAWAGAGIVFNIPVAKRVLWGIQSDVLKNERDASPETTPESEGKGNAERARLRSLSIERDLLRNSSAVEEFAGRPNMGELTKGFKGDVYVCGPEEMKEDVRRSCGVKMCVGEKKRDWGPVIGKCGIRVWEEIFAW